MKRGSLLAICSFILVLVMLLPNKVYAYNDYIKDPWIDNTTELTPGVACVDTLHKRKVASTSYEYRSYYHATMDMDGYYQFNFRVLNNVDVDDGFEIGVYHYDTNSHHCICSWKNINKDFVSDKMNFAKGTDVWIIVQRTDDRKKAALDKEYELTFNTYEDPSMPVDDDICTYDEGCFSNVINKARTLSKTPIKDTFYKGVSDDDYYKVVVKKTGTVILKFDIPATEMVDESVFDADIYDSNGNSLYTRSFTTGTYRFYAKKGTYYINVYGTENYPAGVEYSISCTTNSDAIPSMKDTKIKLSGRKISVTKAKTYVDSYEIEVSTDKNFYSRSTKKISLSGWNKTSKTLDKNYLEKNKKYYARVRCVRNDFYKGEMVYSGWSKVQTFKYK